MKLLKNRKCEVVVLTMCLSFWLPSDPWANRDVALAISVFVPPLHVVCSSSEHLARVFRFVHKTQQNEWAIQKNTSSIFPPPTLAR